jgi:hypothetical protein
LSFDAFFDAVTDVLPLTWLILSLITGKTPNLFWHELSNVRGVPRGPVFAHRRRDPTAYWASLALPLLWLGFAIWFAIESLMSR